MAYDNRGWRDQHPVALPAGSASSRRFRWNIWWYVSIVILLPGFFLLSSIPIVRSANFLGQSGDPFLIHADYPFSLKHANCEVVIFGDSTAVTGIDPTVVGNTTGLKTCNIAQSQSIFEIVGTLALDTYLKDNTPPKYIIMEFAPETLARNRVDFFWPEGLTVMLRRYSLIRAVPVLVRHPVQAYNFALWAIKTKINSVWKPAADFSHMNAIFKARGGLLILPKPPQTSCTNKVKFLDPTQSWVSALRQKYTVGGTKAFVDMSPIPDCTPDVQTIVDASRGVTDNTPPVYPIKLFCDLDRHLTLQGSERSSLAISRQILAQSGK